MKRTLFFALLILASSCTFGQRSRFNEGWQFRLGDDSSALKGGSISQWRNLDLPHDWSIEGSFSEKHPTTFNQGALPAGIGWYAKDFSLAAIPASKACHIHFEGVYRNAEVWINGHYLGKRPNGYIGFGYEITPHLKAKGTNRLLVRVDNSLQPSSRWYTGSGIYRDVWLEIRPRVHLAEEEIFLSNAMVNGEQAQLRVQAAAGNGSGRSLEVGVWNAGKQLVATTRIPEGPNGFDGIVKVSKPQRWSTDRPYLYTVTLRLLDKGKLLDTRTLLHGFRTIRFDASGFYLNGKPTRILGVCQHHDFGALGAAFNSSAARRQLQILKEMGCNAIRTAHNPPAPGFLDLCDEMGFLVMDEAFDMWQKKKNKFDYAQEFRQWHERDLADMVIRDRNHPSVIMWSIGNEIREQFDSSGTWIATELATIVRRYDTTRPVTSALTENLPEKNFIYQSKALDVLGFNYKIKDYPELPKRFPNEPLLVTEAASALETRGHYDLPADSFRIWPPDSKAFKGGNPGNTVSAYDNTFAYWGNTHEQAWLAVKRHPFLAGTFVWSGFDFLGEPVPYQWPSRSSYYGIIDLAGFPKDVYYLYQSEWTTKPVLHLFPHWNWKEGETVDVWAYYNNADEVELFLNGRSLGLRSKNDSVLHVSWKVPFQAGTLKAVSRKQGKIICTRDVHTAGAPASIRLRADRKAIRKGAGELAFITVEVVDAAGNLVPDADQRIDFSISGPGVIAGTDNGDPVSADPFQASWRKAFHGKCLLILGAKGRGAIRVTASSAQLPSATIGITAF